MSDSAANVKRGFTSADPQTTAAVANAASSLTLDAEQRERLAKFQANGLLWFVNTAVLHPRGLALTMHLDDDGQPLGMSVQGDGDEPWCFADEDAAESVAKFNAAELRREAEWSPKLRGES